MTAKSSIECEATVDMRPKPKRRSKSKNHGTKDKGKGKRKLRSSHKLKESTHVGNLKQDTKMHSLKWAETALAYYKRQTGMHFELVEVVTHFSSIRCGKLPNGTSFPAFWSHLNFKAKQLHPNSDNDNAIPKLFFAELYQRNSYHCTSCSIINPSDSDIIIGCGFCHPGSNARHPPRGLCIGSGPYCPPFTVRRRGQRVLRSLKKAG